MVFNIILFYFSHEMNQTKFIQLIAAFDTDELKSLRKHFSLSIEGTDADRLFALIYSLYPFEDTILLNKEFLFDKLYPGRTYNDSRMRYLTHELMMHTENFIATRSIHKNIFLKQMLLLKYYREKQLDKHFELAYKNLKKDLDAQALRNSDYFSFSYQADVEFNLYLKEKQNRQVEPNIQNLSDNIDAHYLLNKINVYIEALNYKNILKIDYNIRFSDVLFKNIDTGYLQANPTLALHYTALQTLTEPQEEKHFRLLKDLLPAHADLLSEREFNDLLTLARNYCIKRINRGDKTFEYDLFDLYQQEIKQIEEKNTPEISSVLYKNVVTLAINIGETEWIKTFAETHQSRLPESLRKSLYSFNMAKYWFIRKKYDKVIGLLSDVDYKEMFDQLAAKSILLKAYFELEEVQSLESLLHSFRVLLGDKKNLGYHGKCYLNFLRFAEKLFLANPKKKADLKKKMETEKTIGRT